MAISQGFGPHAAWLSVAGGFWPIEHGNVSLAMRKSSSFGGVIPMAWPGARAALANVDNGAEATIVTMTRGQQATLVTGSLDDIDMDYIPGRVIRFSGRDKSSRLHEELSSEKWLNKKPSEIVQDLVGRVGLSGNISVTSSVKAGKQLQQDWVKLSENNAFSSIIHEMARIDGARWWVDAKGTFHYVAFGDAQGNYSVTIQQDSEPIVSDCLSLKIRRNLQAARPHAVTVKGWHPKKREIFTFTSNVEGRGPTRKFNYQVPTVTQDRAQQHAKSDATEKTRNEFTVTSTVVGDPDVVPGMGLSVSGTDFDQTFDIDGVQHDFGMSGHRTNITARSAGEGREAS